MGTGIRGIGTLNLHIERNDQHSMIEPFMHEVEAVEGTALKRANAGLRGPTLETQPTNALKGLRDAPPASHAQWWADRLVAVSSANFRREPRCGRTGSE